MWNGRPPRTVVPLHGDGQATGLSVLDRAKVRRRYSPMLSSVIIGWTGLISHRAIAGCDIPKTWMRGYRDVRAGRPGQRVIRRAFAVDMSASECERVIMPEESPARRGDS